MKRLFLGIFLIFFAGCGSGTHSSAKELPATWDSLELIIPEGVTRDSGETPDVLRDQVTVEYIDAEEENDTKDVVASEYKETLTGDISQDYYHSDITLEEACVPDCTGKECGGDGCGGSCGTCKEGEECLSGKCVCLPQCAGKECGDDGCGGECPPGCNEGIKCIDGECADSTGPCTPKGGSLDCEEKNSVSGNSGIGWSNSDVLDLYYCGGVQDTAPGPEVVYSFSAPFNGFFTVTLKKAFNENYLFLYVLKDSNGRCSSRNCMGFGPDKVSFEARKGEQFYIVVDARENRTASYTLNLVCKNQE